ncbi:hypothetical protein CHARACLAT_027670 [Characodon lateralis]|uniref:Uncharacterized protein n=1 Tax=Characodon lateralis TaxID=208331 RepID=A0ABU7F7K8_9TELE|nr:hypothetical protein [Characodon lateralis]
MGAQVTGVADPADCCWEHLSRRLPALRGLSVSQQWLLSSPASVSSSTGHPRSFLQASIDQLTLDITLLSFLWSRAPRLHISPSPWRFNHLLQANAPSTPAKLPRLTES